MVLDVVAPIDGSLTIDVVPGLPNREEHLAEVYAVAFQGDNCLAQQLAVVLAQRLHPFWGLFTRHTSHCFGVQSPGERAGARRTRQRQGISLAPVTRTYMLSPPRRVTTC